MLRSRSILAPLALCLSLVSAPAAEPTTPPDRLVLSSQLRLHVDGGRRLVLEVQPREGELYEEIAARLCGSADRGVALAAANPGLSEARFGDERLWLRVPLPHSRAAISS